MINALRTPLVLGFALTLFGLSTGCDGDGDENATTDETSDTDPTGDTDTEPTSDTDTDPTGDTETDPTDGSCFDQPPECAQFVRCIGALAPGQAESVEEQYGEDGSCWCGTEDEAQDCYATCVTQVATAIENNPTESQCHENVCAIDELDPTQPYGPVVNGACSDYTAEGGDSIPQVAFNSPFGVPGGFCSPKCSGLANYCPDHVQTTADGTCGISQGEDSYCISRCWVDPTIIGGTQCPCGATCQPQGSPDGEGNLRGLCTFE